MFGNVMRYKVYCYPVKQTTIIFYQKKRKEPSLPSRNNSSFFGNHVPHHLTCTALLRPIQKYHAAPPAVPLPCLAAKGLDYVFPI
jgi:hypothetical protein